jgi:hypothetical protein
MMNIPSSLARAAALALGLLVTGCASGLVPFTHEIREQNRLTDDEIKNLQFYVSHKITLRRELESGSRQVTGSHKLVLTSGKSIEEVVVEEKTPGIALAVKGTVISISFEPGSSLDFVVEGGKGGGPTEAVHAASRTPDPFPGNNARPPELIPPTPNGTPDSLSGNYWLWVEPSGQIGFQGKAFDAVEDSAQAFLLIDSDTLKEVVKNHKVLPGIRLPSR